MARFISKCNNSSHVCVVGKISVQVVDRELTMSEYL